MRVLILGLGAHREFGIVSLKRAGHYVGVIDELVRIPTELVDWWLGLQEPGPRGYEKAAADVPMSNWDALLTWDEMAVEVVAELVVARGIRGPRMRGEALRDKSIMRNLFDGAGLLCPTFRLATSVHEALTNVQEISFPVVVKPVDYGGSSGVRLVREIGELESAAAHALSKSIKRVCIMEEFVDGPEFSVESVSWALGDHQTLGITAKSVSEPPYFVELGHVFPANLEQTTADCVVQTVNQALDCLGMGTGVSHSEVRVGASGVYVIEVGGRQAGDLIPRLVYESTGVNPYLLELAAITGDRACRQELRAAPRTSAVHFFTYKPGARITWPAAASVGSDAVRRSLRDMKVWHPSYAATPIADGNGRRLGYCLFAGTATDVAAASRDAWRLGPLALGDES